ncbi:MAG: ferrochelatase [Candidatus Acidiferrales bacterium]
MHISKRKRIGVVLFQLGGPDSLAAVEPFLYNLFCDPDIINFPGAFLARKPLAKLISTRRSKVVREHYREIGGGSPIGRLTELQAGALSEALAPHVDARVVIAMRYWKPSTHDAIAALDGNSFDELILLPLYPHYSFATTGSSLKEWNRLFRENDFPMRLVENFHDHPNYIAALVENIGLVLARAEYPEKILLVFSAHGLPLNLVERGDPYPRQIAETVRLVCERGAWPNRHLLCYQSRVGPQKWLEPSLVKTIEDLGRKGEKRVLVIPVSFVTEHIETLHEINIEARELAARFGVEEFLMMPALNDSPRFIAALEDLVLRAAGVARVNHIATPS